MLVVNEGGTRSCSSAYVAFKMFVTEREGRVWFVRLPHVNSLGEFVKIVEEILVVTEVGEALTFRREDDDSGITRDCVFFAQLFVLSLQFFGHGFLGGKI